MLRVETSSGSADLSADTLRARTSETATASAGRYGAEGAGVAFGDIADPVEIGDADHVTFHASDGYAVTLPLERALADAVLVIPPEGTDRTGVRLVVPEGETACLNVKAVTRVELRRGPGKHTVDPNPHENAEVPGWDV